MTPGGYSIEAAQRVLFDRAADVQARLKVAQAIVEVLDLAGKHDKGTRHALTGALDLAVADAVESVLLWRTARAELDRAAQAK